ncbi:MAG: MotA/TolQ/ExbB proton channel family protein [Nitrospirae bacterium]|nr:MAG: MotA/TolQ/ExbB proton channel family protein [Nitrospirota bacterium]
MLEVFLKGGFLMYPILLLSVVAVAIIIQKTIQYRALIKGLDRTAEEIFKAPPEIFRPLMETAQKGCDEEELTVVGTRQVREIEKGLSWLGVIAMITPLLGLTGTVIGMIKAFMVISVQSSVNPSMLAGGIWEALITTAAGLLVAIPVHIGHHWLEKQADEITFLLKEATLVLYKRCKDGV